MSVKFRAIPAVGMLRTNWRCRLLRRHSFGGWGDNGCYTIHEEKEGADCWHLMTRFCASCDRMQSKLVRRIGWRPDPNGHYAEPDGTTIAPVFDEPVS